MNYYDHKGTLSKRDIKKGAKMARRVMRGIERGKTDTYARAGVFELGNLPGCIVNMDTGAYKVAKEVLNLSGIEVDAYHTGGGGFDPGQDRIAVTEVHGVAIPPASTYEFELRLRDIQNSRPRIFESPQRTV